MARAYPVFLWLAEDRQLFNVGYRGRLIARDLLGARIVLYQLGKIHLRLESKGHVAGIGPQTIGGQLEPATADGPFQLEQECPAGVA
jgi:hypothetical protein